MTKYYDYIQLDKLLDSQRPISQLTADRQPTHHETFFIIIHQVYELWFKAILFELDSVITTFKTHPDGLDEREIGIIVSKLNRIIEIFKLLVAQIKVMETLTPLDFLDFRDLLMPASGYDSLQFRLIEVKLGLKLDRGRAKKFDPESRNESNETKYGDNALARKHIEELKSANQGDSLFDYVEAWLRRTPFVNAEEFGDWFPRVFAAIRRTGIESNDGVIGLVQGIFDRVTYASFLKDIEGDLSQAFPENRRVDVQVGNRKGLSHDAFLAALFIHLYRDEPILQQPHRLLESLKEMDELLSIWRDWHSSMVLRMIGQKPGTAGPDYGYKYLAGTKAQKFFPELDRISTYLIPRRFLPAIPSVVQGKMDFYYSVMRRKSSRANLGWGGGELKGIQ